MRPILLIGAGLLAALAAGCSNDDQKLEQPIRPVLTVVAEPRALPAVGFAGVVDAQFKSDLGFQVLGRITTRSVNLGDLVHKDQVLATLDTKALEFAVNKSEADLASGKAKLDLSITNEQRQRQLLASNTTTREGAEQATQSREAAQAQYDQLQADLDKAREQLSYSILRADSDGVISAVSAQVGQVVTQGQAVLTLARLQALDAVVDVPDSYGDLIAIGTPFQVTLQSNPSISVKGAVREIAPQADATTRTRRIKISLANAPASFRLGSTVTARSGHGMADTILLPASAIIRENGAAFVWTVDPGNQKIARRAVVTGPLHDGYVSVVSGVTAGERVIIAGVNSLKDGQTVRLEDEISK